MRLSRDQVALLRACRTDRALVDLLAVAGRVNRTKLIEIIRRPVVMRSNMHKRDLQPQTLEICVSDAGPRSAACDESSARVDPKQVLECYREGGK